MSIREKENRLFEKWSASRGGFVADGVVDEEQYMNSVPKLMFILKEVNDPNGGNWDLREFIRDGARSQTWDNVTRWVIGIRRITEQLDWSEIEDITEQQRREHLRSICAINLKKSPGGHTSDNVTLARIANEDKSYLNEQFSFYEPDLVICCGSVVSSLFHNLVEIGEEPRWKTTTRGIRYHEYREKKYIIEHAHPEARVSDCLLHYGLIDAARAILEIA